MRSSTKSQPLASLLWDVPGYFALLQPALAGCAGSLVYFTLVYVPLGSPQLRTVDTVN